MRWHPLDQIWKCYLAFKFCNILILCLNIECPAFSVDKSDILFLIEQWRDLQNNSLEGTVPDSFGGMKNLQLL